MQTLLSSHLAMVAILIVLSLIIGASASPVQQLSAVERGQAGRYPLTCNDYNLDTIIMRNCATFFSKAGPDSTFFVGGIGQVLCQTKATVVSARPFDSDVSASGTEIASAINSIVHQCGSRGGSAAAHYGDDARQYIVHIANRQV